WRRRYPVVGWLWFVGTLVPVLGLVQVGSQALADRYTYIPLIGLFILGVWGAADLARERPRVLRPGLLLATGFWLLAVLRLTSVQLTYWQSKQAVWERALAVAPDNPIAHNNLGLILMSRGEHDLAREHFEAAIKSAPALAGAHNNLGTCLEATGHPEE